MKFEISVEQMAEMTAAVVERDRLRGQLRATEAKNARMRKELTNYQTICERAKKDADGAAAAERAGDFGSGEPDSHKQNKENAGKNPTVLLKSEAEGRVSGGDRAGICYDRAANGAGQDEGQDEGQGRAANGAGQDGANGAGQDDARGDALAPREDGELKSRERRND